MGWMVRLAFARLSMLLPVRRVTETSDIIAFEHPAPAWTPHVLLVPKRSIRSFQQIRPDEESLFGEMVRLAFSRAATRDLYRNGFAVLVNGGAYQDVAQLHLHLAGLDRGLEYAAPSSRPDLT
jgi:histidine triad (HIT) family protein